MPEPRTFVQPPQAPLIYAESYTPTMKFYTLDENTLDSLSADNDRAIRSRSIASFLFGGFIVAITEPLIFMGVEFGKLTEIARFTLFFGAPLLLSLALYHFWDSRKLFQAVDSRKDRVKKASRKTGNVEVRPLEDAGQARQTRAWRGEAR